MTPSWNLSGTVIELWPGRAADVVRIGRGILAQVARPGGRHVASHAVAGFAREELAARRFRKHAIFEQRLQFARLAIEETDLDGVVVEQIVNEVTEIMLEEFDPRGHIHLGQLSGISPANSRPA